MKNMKRTCLVSICLVLIMLFTACSGGEVTDSFEYYGNLMDKEYNGEVLVYGHDTLEAQAPFKLIGEITENALNGDPERNYHAIVVWNPKGEIALSDEELLLIKEYVDDKQYDFIYIGSSQFEKLTELGFTTSFGTNEKGMLYSGYNLTSGVKTVNAFTEGFENDRDAFAFILFLCHVCITTN